MPQDEPTSGFSHFVAEMKRRRVWRFALGYAAAAFVILQLAEIVFPAFGIGESGLRVLVVLTGLGFLPAVVLAWVYDITTEGIRRTDDPAGATAGPSPLALAALLITTLGVTTGLGLYLAGQGAFGSAPGEAFAPSDDPVRLATYDPSVPIRSLAVLPLDDYSPGSDQAYFTSGMHEELIAKLSMLEGVRVVSRTTVMQYRGTTLTAPKIGSELGVDVLIEGSVSRSGPRVRVTLQVIHAPSDSHIETLQWDREDVQDLLAFQTEIAHAVVHEIRSEHEEETFDRIVVASSDIEPAAQEAYLRAKHEYDRGTDDGYRMAFEYFQEAVDRDPDFARAMAGLAGARFLIGIGEAEMVEEEVTLARQEALAALEMDSTSMEAQEVYSFIERSMPRVNGDLAVPEIPLPGSGVHIVTMPGTFDSIVVDMNAFDTAWVSAITSLGERIEESVRRRSSVGGAGGPSPGARQAMEARQLMSSGRYPEAARLLERVVESTPEMTPAWEMLARAHIAHGDVGSAVAVVEEWRDSGAGHAPDRSSVLRLEEAVGLEGVRGYWSWMLDRLTVHESEGRPAPRTELAAAHAGLGRADEAFRYLFDALELGEREILTLRADPVWDDLRSDPRFKEIAREAQEIRLSSGRRAPPRGRDGG